MRKIVDVIYANAIYSAAINAMISDPEISMSGKELVKLIQRRDESYQYFLTAALDNNAKDVTHPMITLLVDIFENVKNEKHKHAPPRLIQGAPKFAQLVAHNVTQAKILIT